MYIIQCTTFVEHRQRKMGGFMKKANFTIENVEF